MSVCLESIIRFILICVRYIFALNMFRVKNTVPDYTINTIGLHATLSVAHSVKIVAGNLKMKNEVILRTRRLINHRLIYLLPHPPKQERYSQRTACSLIKC